MKLYQSKMFNAKRTKGTLGGKRRFLNRNGDTTVVITVMVALFIVCVLLVNLALSPPQEELFDVIYMLDSEQQTDNFPTTVVIDENSTFSLWVGVENHRQKEVDYQVLLKIDDGTSTVGDSQVEAKQTFNKTLSHEELWEFQVTVNIDQQGYNRVIFELWFLNTTSGNMQYTGNWVTLSVEATLNTT